MVDKSLLWFGKPYESQKALAMEARDTLRQTPWLDACQGAPAIFEPVMPRWSTLLAPFVPSFHGQGDEQHATTSVWGRLSAVERQHLAAIASRCGPSRLPLPGCMGSQAWDDEPVRQAWRSQGQTPWGQGAGGRGWDPSGFPTAGCASVGVARPWWGRLGNVAHCPVAL